MSSYKREEIANKVTFNTVFDNKFKTMRISLIAYLPLEKETVSEYALLTKVLLRSCERYPDFTSLSKKLSSLYGATLSADCIKVGDRQMLHFSISGIDERYAFGKEELAKELCDLLCQIVFKPKLIGNSFDEFEFLQGKRELIDIIDSEFNEKRIYALTQALSTMCENEAFGTPRYGTKESVEKVTKESLYNSWQNMLKTATFELFTIGQTNPENVKSTFISYFNTERTPAKLENTVIRKAEKIKEKKEEMTLSQSKMILCFRTDCAEPESEVMAERLMCAILGGTAHSKLFCNVREKLSLCYYCAARYNRKKGILTVESGVEKEYIEKAKEAILAEIESMKKGDITDFELKTTKMSVVNSFKEICDTASGLEEWYVSQLLDGNIYSAEKASELINNVTKEEVIECAKKLTLDTVYTLVGNEVEK